MVLTKSQFYYELKKLKPNQFLTGNNFAKKADFVYSEAISSDEFKKLKIDEINFKKLNSNIYIYSKKKINLKENDLIYCKTDNLFELFAKLNKIKNLKNLKLITHQGAIPSIDKKLYSLKPKCISKWYSVNIGIIRNDLIPIPLGIANSFSDVSLHPEDFLKFYDNYDNSLKTTHENKIYANFRTNTNPIRESFHEEFYDNKNFIFENPNLSKFEFLTKIANYKYIFSPRGLGIDTHRFWEILYAGSTPIAQEAIIYNNFLNYYQEFVNYKDIDFQKFKNIQLDKNLINLLNVDYWISEIKKEKIESDEEFNLDYDSEKITKLQSKISKKYIRYKIINSDYKFITKVKFYIKSVFNFNDNLFNRFWHVDY